MSTILGAAVVDDVIGLIVFSVAIAVTGAQATNLLTFAVSILLFFGVSVMVGPRNLSWQSRWLSVSSSAHDRRRQRF